MTPGIFPAFLVLTAVQFASASISVRVTNTAGEGVPSAFVTAVGARAACFTDSLGACSFADVLPTGCLIAASAPGFLPDTLPLPSTHQITLVLRANPIVLEPLAVTADRLRDSERSTAFVTSIETEELQVRAETVPELLNDIVGVQVRSTGGFGSFSTVSIRSSSSEQVRVYLDGIPLNQALGGGVNLAAIPISVVERVDVYRGVIPPIFGGSGTAGVVNFITRQATDSLRWQANASYGTWDTRTASGWVTRRIGPVAGIASVDVSRSDNDFTYRDDNGTTLNTSDDTWARRTNNQFLGVNTLLRVSSVGLSVPEWSASYCYLHTNNHLPGNSSYHDLPNTARLLSGQHLAEGMVRIPLPLLTEVEIRGYGSSRRDRFENKDGTVGLGRSVTNDRTAAWGGQLTLSSLVVPVQRISLLSQLTREGYYPDEKMITDPAIRQQLLRSSRRAQYSFYVSDEIALLERRVVLNGNFGTHRVSNNLIREETGSRTWSDSTSFTQHPHAVGIIVEPAPWVSIRANVGRYTRVPNLFELYGNRGTSVGNSLLVPEKGANRDIGFVVHTTREGDRLRHASAEVVLFESKITDMIAFWSVYNRMKPFNVGKAQIRGVELAGSLATAFGFSSNLGVTWQHPRNESALYNGLYFGNDLPHRPRWQIDSRSEFSFSRVTLAYGLHYHNRFFGQPVNNIGETMPSAFLHDVGVRFRPHKRVHFSIEGKNLGNVREFHSRYVPLPGRSVFVACQISSS